MLLKGAGLHRSDQLGAHPATALSSSTLAGSPRTRRPQAADDVGLAHGPFRRRAHRRSSASPALWPRESFTSLKLSRSMNITAWLLAPAPAEGDGLLQLAVDLGAVGEPGEGIVIGHEDQPLLGRAAGGDILRSWTM